MSCLSRIVFVKYVSDLEDPTERRPFHRTSQREFVLDTHAPRESSAKADSSFYSYSIGSLSSIFITQLNT